MLTTGFNPLSRIHSVQCATVVTTRWLTQGFQSPFEDSFRSIISQYSTFEYCLINVSIPFRGFIPFNHRGSATMCGWIPGFNPLSRIHSVQYEGNRPRVLSLVGFNPLSRIHSVQLERNGTELQYLRSFNPLSRIHSVQSLLRGGKGSPSGGFNPLSRIHSVQWDLDMKFYLFTDKFQSPFEDSFRSIYRNAILR